MQKTIKAGALEKAGILLDRSNQEITYDKLKEHIRKNHPTKSEMDKTKVANDELKYFTMCDPLGELPIMRCCNKKSISTCIGNRNWCESLFNDYQSIGNFIHHIDDSEHSNFRILLFWNTSSR